MEMKAIVKPFAKWALKFGIDYAMEYAAGRVAANPQKGEPVAYYVESLGELVRADAAAIKDGKYDAGEKAASDEKVDTLVDGIFGA